MGGQLCNNRERTGGNFLGVGGLRLPPSDPLRLSFPGTESGIPVPKSVPGARALEGRTAVLGAPSRTHEQTGARTGPAAALTRFLRRRRFCEVGARLLQRLLALALLRVDVLGLRLLAPRHGARIGAPGRALVTCHQFLELGNFTPLRPERACPSNYYYQ